jgi:hypothetical protein
MPVPNAQSREAQIAMYAAQLNAAFPPDPGPTGANFGRDYTDYMNKHPNANPQLVYETVLVRIEALQSVPSTIGQAIGTGAGAAAGLGQAGAQATGSLYPAWLQGFLGANGLLRIAEGVLGLLIIAVSLDKLLSGNAGIATTVAKVVK